MRARMAIVAVVCSASGCLFPSLDGLTGAGAEASPPDVANDAADAHADAKTGDATTDARADADAASGPFCAQHASATFCADFDESPDPAAGFSSTYLTTGGVVSLDTTEFATSPASLLAGDTTLTNNASSHGAEVKSTGITPAASATLDFDLRIDKLATEGTYIEALAMVFNSPTRSSIQLNLKAASSEVGEEIIGLDGGSTYVGHTLPSPLGMSTWTHLTIALALASPRTITLTVDTNVVLDHIPMNAAFADGSMDLYVGNAYAPGPSDGATLHYDDVLLQLN